MNEPTDVTLFRRRFMDAVSRNEISVADNWAQPCHAANVQAELGSAARDEFGRAQDLIAPMEPSLLRCPPASLHVSVDWPIEVTYEYTQPKASLLENHRWAWITSLDEIARRSMPMTLRFRWIVVTNSAVIALAEPDDAVTRLRHAIRAALTFPRPVGPAATIIHTTLFRYGGSLERPDDLLNAATAIELDVTTTVATVVLSEELVFPSLETRTLARFEPGVQVGLA